VVAVKTGSKKRGSPGNYGAGARNKRGRNGGCERHILGHSQTKGQGGGRDVKGPS